MYDKNRYLPILITIKLWKFREISQTVKLLREDLFIKVSLVSLNRAAFFAAVVFGDFGLLLA